MIVTCTLTFPDEATVTGRVTAEYANETVDVQWTGALERLSRPPQKTDGCVLEAYMDDQAEQTGGTLHTVHDGLWLTPDEVVA